MRAPPRSVLVNEAGVYANETNPCHLQGKLRGDPWFTTRNNGARKQTLRISQGSARGNPNGLCVNESAKFNLAGAVGPVNIILEPRFVAMDICKALETNTFKGPPGHPQGRRVCNERGEGVHD
jgi:hypothetical protein